MSSTDVGLREQKKAATRQALRQAALRLFTENGYERTTVRDIASAAGVTERTFFRYFPSKEDLVYGELLDLVPLVQREIAERPAHEPPLTAVLEALLATAKQRSPGLAVFLISQPERFVASPSRPARPVLFDFEHSIAEALHHRLTAPGGTGAPDGRAAFHAAVWARASVAAIRSALIAHTDHDFDGPGGAKLTGLLREAFAVLESG
ncbi:TetR family transcriptional regulator [Streptantibioticus silvisoli]|uniref:TetR family transcriptional regulator n=1 Tax=Streptantibioticus silvisoli TaxID=2705255 RepID=A0ABT6W3T8_9ACTN|nr:TetR family transcriptional regulator [Streptantibioticus silvisoli]MDI5965411.1 TetR family transcriptional regulator [Streptantibioticus silvisoli]